LGGKNGADARTIREEKVDDSDFTLKYGFGDRLAVLIEENEFRDGIIDGVTARLLFLNVIFPEIGEFSGIACCKTSRSQ
jgi:hypothetical protein